MPLGVAYDTVLEANPERLFFLEGAGQRYFIVIRNNVEYVISGHNSSHPMARGLDNSKLYSSAKLIDIIKETPALSGKVVDPLEGGSAWGVSLQVDEPANSSSFPLAVWVIAFIIFSVVFAIWFKRKVKVLL